MGVFAAVFSQKGGSCGSCGSGGEGGLSFEVRDAAQERRQQLWQDLDSLEIDVSDLIATCQRRGFETGSL